MFSFGVIDKGLSHLKMADVWVRKHSLCKKKLLMLDGCIVLGKLSTRVTKGLYRMVEDAANGSQKGSLAERVSKV